MNATIEDLFIMITATNNENNYQTLEIESGFSVSTNEKKMITLKLTKEIVSKIRNMDITIFDKARMFKIMDSMTKIKNNIVEYPLFVGYKTFIQQNIIPNFDKVTEVLSMMNNNGLIVIGTSDRVNPYNKNKKLESLIVSDLFQTEFPNYYTFTESDIEYSYLEKCDDARKKSNTKRLNDDQIIIPNSFINLIPSLELQKIINDRLQGEVIHSEAMKSTNGRIVTIYSNLKKNLRAELIDNRTGLKLSSIDLKSSQFSFFLAYLIQRVTDLKTRNEVLKLQDLQKTSDFYTFMSNEINVPRCAVKRLVMKMLCGDWRTHFSNFSTECFNNDTVKWFNDNNLSIVCVWNRMMLKFKSLFPSIVYYMKKIMDKKTSTNSKITIAGELQIMESRFMAELIRYARSLSLSSHGEFQFFTVYDCIFFSSDYWNEVKRIVTNQITYWNSKRFLVCSFHEDRIVATLPASQNKIVATLQAPPSLINDFCVLLEKVSIEKEEEGEGSFNTNFFDNSTQTNSTQTTNEVSLSVAKVTKRKTSTISEMRPGSYQVKINGKRYCSNKKNNETREQFRVRLTNELGLSEGDIK